MKTVRLHIDRLRVEGLPADEQRKFVQALEERLRNWAAHAPAEQLSGREVPRIPAVDAGVLRAGTTAAQAASQVVRAVARATAGRSGGSSRGSGEVSGHV